MDAVLSVKILTLGEVRSYTAKNGEARQSQDAYAIVGKSPRPVQVSCDPSLALQAGEHAWFDADIWPSRFSNRELSVTLRARKEFQKGLRSA